MKKLTHLDSQGRARMVDVSQKETTERTARARGYVKMREETLSLISAGRIQKGDVIAVARIAGVMAAKKTSDLIPLCHPLQISAVEIDLIPEPDTSRIRIEASVTVSAQTGVEMEALTAVSAAALTIYDMCKAVDRDMTISEIMLVEKRGGRSGHYRRSELR